MFKVFIDYDKLDEICRNQDEEDPLYNILCNKLPIGTNRDDSVLQDMDTPVFQVFMGKDIRLEDQSDFMNDIPFNKNRVLESPCGAYILPIAPNEANIIQKFHGVMCQSSKGVLSLIPLQKSDIEVSRANSKGQTWERFGYCKKYSPTNTLIIQDRYFFKNDAGETIEDSYENFGKIIATLLPRKLSVDFHLMVIYDFTQIPSKQGAAFDEIAEKLQKIVDKQANGLQYKIVFEVLSIPKGSHKYEKTHNRRIVSNYYRFGADHKLKAFRGTTPLADQTVTCKFLLSKGLDGESDIPEWKHREWIENFRDIISVARKSTDGTYLYYRKKDDGSIDNDVKNIKNRLLI